MLNKDNGIPYYKQITEIIKKRIYNKNYKCDERIPSEFELCKEFDVNRHTIRQTVNELVNDGFLIKKRGIGTFVSGSNQVVDYKVSKRTSFSENIIQLGLEPKANILKAEEIEADEYIASCLNLNDDMKVYRLEILRMINDIPAILTTSYLNKQRVPDLLGKLDDFKSLYGLLEIEYGLKLYRVKSYFKSDYPNLNDCNVLNIAKKEPILIIQSFTKSKDDNAEDDSFIEYCISRVVSSTTQIVVEF